MQANVLESVLLRAGSNKDADWQKKQDTLLDEQPHLMGFLYNLADDFTEPVHVQIIRIATLLTEAFALAGVPVKLINADSISEVVEEKVNEYEEQNELGEPDDETAEHLARSPMVFARIKEYMEVELGMNMPVHSETRQNIFLILDVIIGLMEENATVEDLEKPKSE